MRTGENTSSTEAQIGSNARQAQQALTGYNAQRDTQNLQNWTGLQQGYLGDQLAGANSQAGIYGTATGGQDSTLGNLTSIQNSENSEWSNIIGAGIGAGGVAGAAAIKKY